MDLYAGKIVTEMWVRALYDYQADDQTSLSFRKGDVIQVLNQLESGWWDGMINEVRGWFPSNFCELLSSEDVRRMEDDGNADVEPDTDDEYDFVHEHEAASHSRSTSTVGQATSHHYTNDEVAACWIPQCTPDGALYYFNTLTGSSARELPLESPTSVNETGPRTFTDPAAMRLRPSAEMYSRSGAAEDAADEHSASETEDMTKSGGSSSARRRSDLSEGASPATSMESLSMEPAETAASRSIAKFTRLKATMESRQSDLSSVSGAGTSRESGSNMAGGPMPQRFFDDPNAVRMTWNRLFSDMHASIHRYMDAINNADRGDFVRRVGDIADHWRLILAAASGTTDNHSGSPSIISQSKSLYPHFRDVMSKFSKLVITTDMAAKDWPTGDLYAKCLHEAEGVLNGVQGFVEVARRRGSEEVPRVMPGFVLGYKSGGNWQNNGLYQADSVTTLSFTDQDEYQTKSQPSERLNAAMLEKLRAISTAIRASMQVVDRLLVADDKMLTAARHEALSNEIAQECVPILQYVASWTAAVESLDLSHLRKLADTSQLNDFAMRKQNVYNQLGELVVRCQELAAPLADEWTADRGLPYKDRVERLKNTVKDLESATVQVEEALNRVNTALSQDVALPAEPYRADSALGGHQLSASAGSNRSLLGDISQVAAMPSNRNLEVAANAERSKVQQMFGEIPQVEAPRESDTEGPDFLQLEHEGEIVYDKKGDNHTIRGGTLVGLVEQLTRHDKHDSTFLNTFLLTYQSFTTATELFELLAQRWSIQPRSGLNVNELKVWTKVKQEPIRFRVVNVLKTWVDTYWLEPNDHPSKALLQKIHAFARNTVANSSTPRSLPLAAVVEQRIRGEDPNPKKMISTMAAIPPPSILPKNIKKLRMGDRVTDVDPREFARQLTIIESRLYCKIKRHECLNKVWTATVATDTHPAANVKALILNSNRLTNWVAESILAQPEVKKRVAVIKHFVSVAEHCLVLANFSTLTAVISAFGTSPIDRLQRTWKEVPAKTMTVLEKMRALMHNGRNFAEYREALHKSNPPCIPFFGVYLTDLTFIEDGIPSRLKRQDLINFSKRTKIAEVVREIQTYQNASYSFQSVSELQDYILSSMQVAVNVNDLYNKSLLLEPRERDHEKIERYVASLLISANANIV